MLQTVVLNKYYKCHKYLWPLNDGDIVQVTGIDYINDHVDYEINDAVNNTRFFGRLSLFDFKDSFIEWMYYDNMEEARNAFPNTCCCGVDATYRDKKDFDTTYMHSYYCPMYKEKPKDNDEQKDKKR